MSRARMSGKPPGAVPWWRRETARVHHAGRRRGGGMAARSARAAVGASDTACPRRRGDRVSDFCCAAGDGFWHKAGRSTINSKNISTDSFARGGPRAATSTHRTLPQPETKARQRAREQGRRRVDVGSNAARCPCSFPHSRALSITSSVRTTRIVGTASSS